MIRRNPEVPPNQSARPGSKKEVANDRDESEEDAAEFPASARQTRQSVSVTKGRASVIRRGTSTSLVDPLPTPAVSVATQRLAAKAAAKEMGISVTQYEEMKETFSLFDADGSGSIDPKEIRTQMSALGFEVDNTTIYQLISDLDSDGSQKIEFDEFAGLLIDLGLYKRETTSRHSCSEVFDFLDELDPLKRDGVIDKKDLRKLADVLGDVITDQELELMIRGADRQDTGTVSSDDYYQLMIGYVTKMEGDKEIFEEAEAYASERSSNNSEGSDDNEEAKTEQKHGKRGSLAVQERKPPTKEEHFKMALASELPPAKEEEEEEEDQ